VGCETVAQEKIFDEKTRDKKSRGIIPLRQLLMTPVNDIVLISSLKVQ
jgi:hypothetical protein